MSTPLLILVTLAYGWTSLEQFYNGGWQTGLMFAGYTVANFGLMGLLK